MRIFKKLAQTTTPSTTTVIGTPTPFLVTELYPSVILGLNGRNINFINLLGELLNKTIYYMSNGEIKMYELKQSSFNSGTTSVKDPLLKHVIDFAALVHNNLFTNKDEQYKKELTPEEIKAITQELLSSSELSVIPSSNPTSFLTSKIGGNLKEFIIKYLSNIR
jgi:hypothetical protein